MSTSMQARIDLCSFATIVKGYADRGMQPRTKSDMLWRIVEDMAVLAERSGVERFTSVAEANRYLASVGIEVGSSERARKHIYKDLVKEAGLAEFGSADIFNARPVTKDQVQASAETAQKPLADMSQDEISEMAKRIAASMGKFTE